MVLRFLSYARLYVHMKSRCRKECLQNDDDSKVRDDFGRCLWSDHSVDILNLTVTSSLACPNFCNQRQTYPGRHCYCLSTIIVFNVSISEPCSGKTDCTVLWATKTTNEVPQF